MIKEFLRMLVLYFRFQIINIMSRILKNLVFRLFQLLERNSWILLLISLISVSKKARQFFLLEAQPVEFRHSACLVQFTEGALIITLAVPYTIVNRQHFSKWHKYVVF